MSHTNTGTSESLAGFQSDSKTIQLEVSVLRTSSILLLRLQAFQGLNSTPCLVPAATGTEIPRDTHTNAIQGLAQPKSTGPRARPSSGP